MATRAYPWSTGIRAEQRVAMVKDASTVWRQPLALDALDMYPKALDVTPGP